MFTGAVILFALAALGGITMLALHLQNKSIPMALAVVHGILAAAGLILLIIGVASTGVFALSGWSLGLFIIAALGGFALFAIYLRGKRLPTALIIVHGLIAVIAFLLLIGYLINAPR